MHFSTYKQNKNEEEEEEEEESEDLSKYKLTDDDEVSLLYEEKHWNLWGLFLTNSPG